MDGAAEDSDDAQDSCRRRKGRRQQESLKSSAGTVLDLSAGGMRCLGNRKLSGEVTVVVYAFTGELELQARVVWTRKCGMRRHEFGLEFLEVDAEMRRQLTSVSTDHGLLRVEAA